MARPRATGVQQNTDGRYFVKVPAGSGKKVYLTKSKRQSTRMVPKLGPTRIRGASVSAFKSELEPQLDLRPKHLPDDGGQPQSNRSS